MVYKSGALGFLRGLIVGGASFAGLFFIPMIMPNNNFPILILATFAIATIISIVLGVIHQIKGKSVPSTYVVGLFGGFTTIFDIVTILYAIQSGNLLEFIHRILI